MRRLRSAWARSTALRKSCVQPHFGSAPRRRAAAVECWHSSDYQAAMKIREPIATADVVIVEGYEGPQPA